MKANHPRASRMFVRRTTCEGSRARAVLNTFPCQQNLLKSPQ